MCILENCVLYMIQNCTKLFYDHDTPMQKKCVVYITQNCTKQFCVHDTIFHKTPTPHVSTKPHNTAHATPGCKTQGDRKDSGRKY